MTISRRGLLKSFAALAAVAVYPETIQALSLSDNQKLLDMMTKGEVRGCTFYLDGPIILGTDNLSIVDCRFIFECAEKIEAAITIDASRVNFVYCRIVIFGGGAKTAIKVARTSKYCLIERVTGTNIGTRR